MAISLDTLRRGKQSRPPVVVVYGTHGIGKSSLAAEFPAPVFIATEDGLSALDVVSFPVAETWRSVLESIGALIKEEHQFKTCVLDTADWAERLIHQEVATKAGVASIGMIKYGAGYVTALNYWKLLIEGFTKLRAARSMSIVVLAHSQQKRFDSPESEPYDRHTLDLHKDAASLLEEWADAVLFCGYKTHVVKDDVGFNNKIARAIGTGERVIYTAERPAFHAKNRYSLPFELPFHTPAAAYAAFSDGFRAAFADVPAAQEPVHVPKKRAQRVNGKRAEPAEQEQRTNGHSENEQPHVEESIAAAATITESDIPF